MPLFAVESYPRSHPTRLGHLVARGRFCLLWLLLSFGGRHAQAEVTPPETLAQRWFGAIDHTDPVIDHFHHYVDVQGQLEEMDGWVPYRVLDDKDGDGKVDANDSCPILFPSIESSQAAGSPLELRVPLAHHGPITTMSLSDDGRWLITGSEDGTALVWDAVSGVEIRSLRPPASFRRLMHNSPSAAIDDLGPKAVGAAALSANGELALTVTAGTLDLWNTITGDRILLPGTEAPQATPPEKKEGCGEPTPIDIGAINAWFLADQRSFALRKKNCRLEIWSLDGQPQALSSFEATGCDEGIFSLDSAGKQLAVTIKNGQMTDGGALLWDLERKASRVIPGLTHPVRALEFSTDGLRMATVEDAGGERIVKWWNPETLQVLGQSSIQSGGAMRFSPDVATLYTHQENGQVCARSLDPQADWCLDLADSRNSRSIVSTGGEQATLFLGGIDGSVRAVDTKSRSIILDARPPPIAVEGGGFSPDGKSILTYHEGGAIHLWRMDGSVPFRRFQADDGPVMGAALQTQDERVVAVTPQASYSWEALSGKRLSKKPVVKPVPVNWESSLEPLPGTADGRFVIIQNADLVEVWEADSHTLLGVCQVGYSPMVVYALFGERLLVGTADGQAQLFQWKTGELIAALPTGDSVLTAGAFALDGERLATADRRGKLTVWAASSGRELVSRVLPHDIKALAWSAQFLFTGGTDATVRRWEPARLAPPSWTKPAALSVVALAASPDGSRVASALSNGRIQVWATTAGNWVRSMKSTAEGPVRKLLFSPEGRALAVWTQQTVNFYHLELGEVWKGKQRWLDFPKLWKNDALNHLVSAYYDGALQPDNVREGVIPVVTTDARTLVWLGGHGGQAIDVASGQQAARYALRPGMEANKQWAHLVLSDDPASDWVLMVADVEKGYLFERQSGRLLRYYDLNFGLGPRILARTQQMVVLESGKFVRYDLVTGKQVGELKVRPGIRRWDYDPNMNRFAVEEIRGVATLLEGASGEELATIHTHVVELGAATFSSDGRILLTGGKEGTVRLSDPATGAPLVTLLGMPDGRWATADPRGFYDAPNGGEFAGMYWVWRREVIALEQLKQRYYAPFLLARVLGLHPEPLPTVPPLRQPRLPPVTTARLEQAGNRRILKIEILPRDGGIGAVHVALNGKEIVSDARRGGGRAKIGSAKQNSHITLRLDPWASQIDDAGKVVDSNQLEVMVGNAAGDLAGLPVIVPIPTAGAAQQSVASVAPIGTRGVGVGRSTRSYVPDGPPPQVWGVLAGVSDYEGSKIDLNFSSRDAVLLEAALKRATHRQLGRDRVHLTLLTTEPGNHLKPTKKAILQALDELIEKAQPQDLVILFLAGHGMAEEHAEGHSRKDTSAGDYYFLTQDATGNELSGKARAGVTISGKELSARLIQIKAMRQILILDTCHAGAAIGDVASSSGVPPAQVRALDRMKDRAGLYILSGAASNAQALESNTIQQGLVTFSLLSGLKDGSVLVHDKVDVVRLLFHVTEQVPQLAARLHWQQTPTVATPRGAASFAIGALTPPDQACIEVASWKPTLVRSRFVDEVGEDSLDLEPAVDKALDELGRRKDLWEFADVRKAPGAWSVVGHYRREGMALKLKLVLKRNGVPVGDPIVITPAFAGTDPSPQDVSRLAKDIVEAVASAVANAEPISLPAGTAPCSALP